MPLTMQLSVLSPENIFCNSCSTHSCLQKHNRVCHDIRILLTESARVRARLSDLRFQPSEQWVRLGELLELIGLVSAQTNDVTQSLRCIGLPLNETKLRGKIQLIKSYIYCLPEKLLIMVRDRNTEMSFYFLVSLWVNEFYESLGELFFIQPLLRIKTCYYDSTLCQCVLS